MTKISFGTDGWRARIAEEYTFNNVRRCTQGFANFLIKEGRADQGVVIGYDQRFQAEDFAASAAEVMAANNIHVWLTERNTPTPAISHAVVDKEAGGAINITASHNPPTDSGFKVRDPQGGAIPPRDLQRIEKLIPDDIKVPHINLDNALSDGLVTKFDATLAYFERLNQSG